MKTQVIKLDAIRLDGGTQPREAIDESAVAEYAEHFAEGDALPVITLYFDGAAYWLADGFHRYHAAKKAGFETLCAGVVEGTRRDAVLFSVSANIGHGLRRTNADKRRAVLTLLTDPEWVKWSDRDIAKRCGVSHPFVANERRSLVTVTSEPPPARAFTTKRGTTATMKTGNIGRSKSPPPPPTFDSTNQGVPNKNDPASPLPPPPAGAADDPVAEAVGRAGEFKALINEVREMKRRILAFADDPVGAEIRKDGIELDCENIATSIRFAVPHKACPFGLASRPTCDKIRMPRVVRQDRRAARERCMKVYAADSLKRVPTTSRTRRVAPDATVATPQLSLAGPAAYPWPRPFSPAGTRRGCEPIVLAPPLTADCTVKMFTHFLRADGTQGRAAIDPSVVADFAEKMRAGVSFPPLVVFVDDRRVKWLADGHHRYHAAKAAGLGLMWIHRRLGSKRDALLSAIAANARSGRERTLEDERHAALTLLRDLEWRRWSVDRIARHCQIPHALVAQLRAQTVHPA